MAAADKPVAKPVAKLVDKDGRATVDLLIEREDLGTGCATLVAAGDKVPGTLADMPKRAR